MPHGGPDWGTEGPLATVYTMQDMAELAARLGKINTFDRRGNVLFFDDFEDSLNKWDIVDVAGVAKAEITNKYARNGSFSALLQTDAVKGTYQRIRHYIPYPALSKMGFEFSFSIGQNVDSVLLTLDLSDDTYRYYSRVRLYPQSVVGKYWIKGWDWADLPDITHISLSPYCFNTVKLVMDYPRKKYDRLLVNNVAMDLSNLDCFTGAYVPIPQLMVRIGVMTDSNAAAIIYVDDAIITQNEP